MCETAIGIAEYDESNDGYEKFRDLVKVQFSNLVGDGIPLFTTGVEDLFSIFLDNLPEQARQHYTCHACRHFFNRYGDLLTISDDGTAQSVLWDEDLTPSFFKPAVKALRKTILKSKINGVFKTDLKVLGMPVTGAWTHFSVLVPEKMRHRSRVQSASQLMAEKLEDRKMLFNALTDYSLTTIEQAVSVLKSETLYRGEKTLGIAEWFRDVKIKFENKRNKDNFIWQAVATAPAGFCHIRSSMIGTLLDDIESGMEFAAVKRRWDEKMSPLQYQRPQAAPSAGNIEQAEKLVEKLGIQNSLKRRFARLDEIETIWRPKEKPEQTQSGVFGHLVTKDKQPPARMELPSVTMTWQKFHDTVLPHAEKIEFMVPSIGPFSAIVTAVDMDAPPIIQWDREDRRNPFSWYLYSNGSPALTWGLTNGYRPVTAVTYQPSMWYEENAHQGKAVFFLIDGAKDSGHKGAGNALFPEILKSELREIRSTIEAYSRKETLEGYEESSACGIRLPHGTTWNSVVRVTTKDGVFTYKLDRWD